MKNWLICCALVPFPAFAAVECPLVEGAVVEGLVSSNQLVQAMSSVPPERDEYQTTADYLAMARAALGPFAQATIFEVEGLRSFISYNADEQRVEVGTGLFDYYSILDFDSYRLRDFYELTIDDFERYMSEHLIVGVGESKVATEVYSASNAFGLSKEVIAYDRVSVHIHGGLYQGIEPLIAWSFTPDEFIDGGYGIRVPSIVIPMASDLARTEVPSLRAVIATTGLSEKFFVTNTYFQPNVNVPEKITSTNFLFSSEILCGGFIDSASRVIKVVHLLDERIPYPRGN